MFSIVFQTDFQASNLWKICHRGCGDFDLRRLRLSEWDQEVDFNRQPLVMRVIGKILEESCAVDVKNIRNYNKYANASITRCFAGYIKHSQPGYKNIQKV